MQWQEDAIDAHSHSEQLRRPYPERAHQQLGPSAARITDDTEQRSRLLRQLEQAATAAGAAAEQGEAVAEAEKLRQTLQGSAGEGRKAVVGDIHVPPKRNKGDF